MTRGTPLLFSISFHGLWLCVFTLVLIQCQKDEVPSRSYVWKVTGKILERGTDKPIPNALVRLRQCESEFLGPVSCYTYDTDTTDAEGNYELQYTNEDYYMHIDAFADQYFALGQEKLINRGEEDGFDIRLTAFSNMKLTFLNTRANMLFLTFQVQTSNEPNFFQDIRLDLQQDTCFNFRISSLSNSKIFSYLRDLNGNLIQNRQDTAYCPPHDTLFKTIIF